MSANILVYTSTYGGTKNIIDHLAGLLPEDVKILTFNELSGKELQQAERIAIGGAIHGGALQTELKEFLEEKTEELRKKRLALFLTCMQREYVEEYFLREFPHELTGEADVLLCLGGDADPDRLNAINRRILKRTTGSDERRQWHDTEAMDRLVQFFKA